MNQQTATHNQIEDWHKQATSYIHSGTLSKAIEALRPIAQTLEKWSLVDKLNDYEMQINLMMDYLQQGAEDPHRTKVYRQLQANLQKMLILLGSYMEIKELCPLYETLNRQWQGRHNAEELQRIINDLSSSHAFLDTQIDQASEEEVMRQIELHSQRQHDLFYYQMTQLCWNRDEQELMHQLLSEQLLPEEDLCIAISGITISLLMYADANKLEWLLSAYQHIHSNPIKARALVGFVFVVSKTKSIFENNTNLVNHLLSLRNDALFTSHVKQTIVQIYCQKQTNATQQRMSNVILPDLLKYSNKKMNELKEEEKMEPSSELSSSWKMEERMEKHFNELMKRTKRGEDIQYTPFKDAKQHAFFHEMANWFLPFNALNKYMVDFYGIKNQQSVIMRIATTNYYCASDCYSFCLIFSKLPYALRKQIGESNLSEQLEELNQEEFSSNNSFEQQMKLYLQDLYRFSQLFAPYKKLQNQFFCNVPEEFIAQVCNQAERIDLYQQLADLLFTLKDYKQACTYYEQYLLPECQTPSVLLLQKIGFCYQQLEWPKEALRWLTKADIADPNNSWTLRHLAQCHEMNNDYTQALVCYQQLESIQPENAKLLELIGELYEKTQLYDEALPYFHKTYFLQANQVQVLAHIAQCLLHLKRYEEAYQYCNRLIEKGKATIEDQINAGIAAGLNGNLHLCMCHLKEALGEMGSMRFHHAFALRCAELKKSEIDTCEIEIACNLVMVQA
ncbi:MAG: tetratricopeptide repeat protein [Mediterranea sp.]|nr:tetratricopeptide repeat protein [Mediterranea sp.]